MQRLRSLIPPALAASLVDVTRGPATMRIQLPAHDRPIILATPINTAAWLRILANFFTPESFGLQGPEGGIAIVDGGLRTVYTPAVKGRELTLHDIGIIVKRHVAPSNAGAARLELVPVDTPGSTLLLRLVRGKNEAPIALGYVSYPRLMSGHI